MSFIEAHVSLSECSPPTETYGHLPVCDFTMESFLAQLWAMRNPSSLPASSSSLGSPDLAMMLQGCLQQHANHAYMKAVSDFDQARQMSFLLQACATPTGTADQKPSDVEAPVKTESPDLEDWKDRVRKLESLNEKKECMEKVEPIPASVDALSGKDCPPPPPPPPPVEEKLPKPETETKKVSGVGLHRVGCFDVLEDDTLEIWARVVPGRKKRVPQATDTPKTASVDAQDKGKEEDQDPAKILV